MLGILILYVLAGVSLVIGSGGICWGPYIYPSFGWTYVVSVIIWVCLDIFAIYWLYWVVGGVLALWSLCFRVG